MESSGSQPWRPVCLNIKNMNSLAQFLPSLIHRIPAQPELLKCLVFSYWADAVGEGLSRRTRPLGWQHGQLTVAVSSAAWKKELVTNQAEILGRLERCFQFRVVHSLVFKIDVSLEKSQSSLCPVLTEQVHENKSPLPPDSITDVRLREALISAARQYLNRPDQLPQKKKSQAGR
jgi:hypothetical protein